jgi:hypothetical protein
MSAARVVCARQLVGAINSQASNRHDESKLTLPAQAASRDPYFLDRLRFVRAQADVFSVIFLSFALGRRPRYGGDGPHRHDICSTF